MLWDIGMLMAVVEIPAVVMGPIFVRYKRSGNKDSKILNHIRKYWKSTLSECAVKCEMTDTCEAFSFHSGGNCELNEYNADHHLAKTLTENGWNIFIRHRENCWGTGYSGLMWNGTCYFWPSSHLVETYFDSRSLCIALESHLACMETEEEKRMLNDTVPMKTWWFGLNTLGVNRVLYCNGKVVKDERIQNTPSTFCGFVQNGYPAMYYCYIPLELPYVCERKWQ